MLLVHFTFWIRLLFSEVKRFWVVLINWEPKLFLNQRPHNLNWRTWWEVPMTSLTSPYFRLCTSRTFDIMPMFIFRRKFFNENFGSEIWNFAELPKWWIVLINWSPLTKKKVNNTNTCYFYWYYQTLSFSL